MAFTPRRPTQQLNIHCSNCGAVTVHFDSYISDGAIFEMVSTKLSEILAFTSASPDDVLCEPCASQIVRDTQNRRIEQRDQIVRQMEMEFGMSSAPGPRADRLQGPARYGYGQGSLGKTVVGSKGRKLKDLFRPRRAVSDQYGIQAKSLAILAF
jgi:hypothetical protein